MEYLWNINLIVQGVMMVVVYEDTSETSIWLQLRDSEVAYRHVLLGYQGRPM